MNMYQMTLPMCSILLMRMQQCMKHIAATARYHCAAAVTCCHLPLPIDMSLDTSLWLW
jgi:hypothetical protein